MILYRTSLPGSSVHGILQARILEWVAVLLQRIFPTQGLKPPLTSLALGGGFFTTGTTWEAQGQKLVCINKLVLLNFTRFPLYGSYMNHMHFFRDVKKQKCVLDLVKSVLLRVAKTGDNT